MKKILPVLILIALMQLADKGWFDGVLEGTERFAGQVLGYTDNSATAPADSLRPAGSFENNDGIFAAAFQNQRSNFQVQGSGRVTRILADDNDGSAHQRFIVSLDSGQTLLIAHNIDLAPRIAGIKKGDPVAFYGEYEWNSEGGVMHWTHHDPQGGHAAGWIKHEGRTYQ